MEMEFIRKWNYHARQSCHLASVSKWKPVVIWKSLLERLCRKTHYRHRLSTAVVSLVEKRNRNRYLKLFEMVIGNGYLFRSRTQSRSHDRNMVQDIFGSRCLIGHLKWISDWKI